ncbi:hypothetical protein ABT084_11130 [Streptomyces sp. NPDC002138]|uniref:hypothetical protein n=1 Tax=Streptomyces sp. NPDC002138 TaxID=3154410 RepID=UPI00332BEED7
MPKTAPELLILHPHTLEAPEKRRRLRLPGEDIERDWVERTGCWSSVTRVLLTYEQMRAYGLPATEGKRGDPRWPAFARRYGFDIERPVQWEVEALEPDELQRLVLAAVDPYIDRDVLAQQIAREEQQRRALEGFAGRWGAPNQEPSKAGAGEAPDGGSAASDGAADEGVGSHAEGTEGGGDDQGEDGPVGEAVAVGGGGEPPSCASSAPHKIANSFRKSGQNPLLGH